MNNVAEITIGYSTKVKAEDRKSISNSKDAYKIFNAVFPSLEHREYFYILCLNRTNRLLGYNQISIGGIHGTVAEIKIIFQAALKANSCAIILGHNHPSGHLKPSELDIKLTKKLVEAGKHLEIAVLDHLILNRDTYFSLADEDLMKT